MRRHQPVSSRGRKRTGGPGPYVALVGIAVLALIPACSGGEQERTWSEGPTREDIWRPENGVAPVYKMWQRADQWRIELPAHSIGHPLPEEHQAILASETIQFDSLEFQARPGRDNAPPRSSVWRTPFPIPRLVRADRTLLPDAFPALKVRVDGRDCRTGRYLDPSIHEPGRWEFRDGDLIVTTPVGQRPRHVSLTLQQTRAWHRDWARALWEGTTIAFSHRTIEINGDRRQAILLPAPASVSDLVQIPPHARLEAAVGIRPVPAVDPGDGVRFVATFQETDTGQSHPLIDVTVDPRTEQGQTWVEVTADLEALAGKTGTLTFRTLPRSSTRLDLAAVAHPRMVPSIPQDRGPWNLLFVVIDTLRADHLSIAGGPVPTPHLDAIGTRGWWFPEARSTSCWTGPAMASLFSGHYPAWFGSTRFMVSPPAGFDQIPLLFDLLDRSGWVTWGQQTNPVLKGDGWCRGLEACAFNNDAPAETVTDAAIDWLSRRGGEPFLAYVHYMDPHLPYVYHAPKCENGNSGAPCAEPDHALEQTAAAIESLMQGSRAGGVAAARMAERDAVARLADTEEEKARIRRLYGGEVRHVDEEVGRLLDWLEKNERMQHTVVVVVSDHGEELWEHGGFEHGHSFHREVSGVVLLLWAPEEPSGSGAGSGAGSDQAHSSTVWPAQTPPRGRVSRLVSLLDVLPTVVRLLGLAVPEGLPGTDLLVPEERSFLFGENVLYGPPQHAVYHENWVLIADETGKNALFDPVQDRREQRDLAGDHPEQVARMTRAFAEHLARHGKRPGASSEGAGAGTDQELDPGTRDQLRALGYVE